MFQDLTDPLHIEKEREREEKFSKHKFILIHTVIFVD